MDIRQLRLFLSVIKEGGVSAAAEANFITQPAVSSQLKKLEEEVGEKLIERRRGKVVPTQAGRVLAEHAEAVVARLETLHAAMAGLEGLERGFLRIGNIDAASVYVLPSVYRTFHQRHPGVKIEIVMGDTAGLVAALARSEIELAATTLPIPSGDFQTIPIYRDEMVLVTHPKHVLAGKRRVTLEDVAQTGLIAYPPGSTTRRLIERVFFERGLALNATMELSSPEAIKRLTQAGLGASILPRAVVSSEIRRGGLRAITVGKHRFAREIGMIFRDEQTLSPPARVFLDMVRERFAGGTNR
jgi:DNA-binding transcriptional LysR family regulator